jgi:Zn-dependent peptidase ImmA (M78 family)
MTTAEGRPHVLPEQLRSARELLGLSTREVAGRLGVSEESVRSWEAGTEEPGAEDLWELADIYQRSPDYFLKATPETPPDIKYRLAARRSLDQLSRETRALIARFEELCRWRHELAIATGTDTRVNVPHHSREALPDSVAEAERHRLGLDGRPVRDPRALLEDEGVAIFELPVPGEEFAGFSWWSDAYGPCVLVNASDSRGRRNFTTAHEYAHLLHRDKATICDLSGDDHDDEKFADRFAASFLMPATDVRRWAEERALAGTVPGTEELTPLANRYNVSLEAIGRRLEELGIIPRGATNSRLEEWQGQSFFRRRAKRPTWRRRLGEKYVRSAFDAYGRGVISLDRLAELLDLDVRKVRELYQREVAEQGAS